MIVIDTSARFATSVAPAFNEPEREQFVETIQRATKVLINTISVVEARMVVHGRHGQRAVVLVDDLLRLPMFEIVAPTEAEMNAAYSAFVAFSKGSGHPASLNFGDALAMRSPGCVHCQHCSRAMIFYGRTLLLLARHETA